MSLFTLKPPRAYQPGRLLNQVVREFDGFRQRLLADGQVELTTANNRVTFSIAERIEKRFLAYTVSAEFELVIPGSQSGQAEIQLEHTGMLTRTGIRGRVKRGGQAAAEMAQRLVADEALLKAMLPLDFQYFYLAQDERGWRAVTGQMGASWVSMAFPPTRRYIPMGRDQVESLAATFDQLQKLLGHKSAGQISEVK